MDQIHDLEKGEILSFSCRTELIQFVSQDLALQYKNKLKSWGAKATDDSDEAQYWERRIKKEIPKLQRAIKKLLKKVPKKDGLEITADSVILKEAFTKAKIKGSPTVCFANNIKYRIDNLTFQRNFI